MIPPTGPKSFPFNPFKLLHPLQSILLQLPGCSSMQKSINRIKQKSWGIMFIKSIVISSSELDSEEWLRHKIVITIVPIIFINVKTHAKGSPIFSYIKK